MKKSRCSKGFYFLLFTFEFLFFSSCSIQKQIAKSAHADVLDTKALKAAHVGISIFDPAANKYLYNYQGDKYFVPASNTKLPTCYAAMKYLGDSLVGLRYKLDNGEFIVQGTGDPTFLNSEFKNQPVFGFIDKIVTYSHVNFSTSNWQEKHLGSGWSWNDYNEYYMAERSPFPIYGNIIRFYLKDNRLEAIPSIFDSTLIFLPGATFEYADINRSLNKNEFFVSKGNSKFKEKEMPFSTGGYSTATFLLNDTLHTKRRLFELPEYLDLPTNLSIIHSQPTDSLLKPMMHRSDNFFAEQTLLMVSNERLGVMSDAKIIDTLLKTDFKDLPQKPRWVDGSGLSRYNLFTPQDFVAILNKMRNEFGMERIKVILATGGEGTISSYYKADSGYIYGKTGTLSGVVAFSGFLYTKKGKLLIFSTLINNHQATATDVRRAIEKFLQGVRNNY
ncbi:MAG: D-alanyl-D-alanine carboxypeptidase [Bacteroidota bacterium]